MNRPKAAPAKAVGSAAGAAQAMQALFMALERGDRQGAEAALAQGARLDDGSGQATSALAAAVEAGSPACVALLLARGADANAMPADGRSPLILAVERADSDGEGSEAGCACVQLLLDAGADPWAVPGGDVRVGDRDREAGVRPLPALALALMRGHARVLEAMRPWLAGADSRRVHGRTLLGMAVMSGCEAGVLALLAAGADPGLADAHGQTPLQMSRNCPSDASEACMIGLLLDAGLLARVDARAECEARLGDACKRWSDATALALLTHGVSANAGNPDTMPPIVAACCTSGYGVHVLDALIEHGACVDAQVASSGVTGAAGGRTALMQACLYPNSLGLVRRLLAAGARLDIEDDTGLTALGMARDAETAVLLLEAGAEVREKDMTAQQNPAVRDAVCAWQAAKAAMQRLDGVARGARRRLA